MITPFFGVYFFVKDENVGRFFHFVRQGFEVAFSVFTSLNPGRAGTLKMSLKPFKTHFLAECTAKEQKGENAYILRVFVLLKGFLNAF